MKIIEIRNTSRGEVAYLYDEASMRVVKVWVVDQTREGAGDDEPVYERPVRTVRARVRRQPIDAVEEEYEVNSEQEPAAEAPRRIPVRQSIIPPHLAGVFKQPGTPGAAEEVRRV